MAKTLSQRLWAKIDTRGDDECWPWLAGTNGDGYGQIRSDAPESRHVLAHRVVYELAHGPLADGVLVRHTCDFGLCCNPKHLVIGDKASNADDAVLRGRHARAGGRHRKCSSVVGTPVSASRAQAVLTADEVVSIREQRAQGATLQSIADLFGVTKSNIHYITTGKTWRVS
jgi:hypothetical protein